MSPLHILLLDSQDDSLLAVGEMLQADGRQMRCLTRVRIIVMTASMADGDALAGSRNA